MNDEAVELLRELLLGGQHEGPCVNVIGDDPELYDRYDSCALHIEAYERRSEAARRFLRTIDDTQ